MKHLLKSALLPIICIFSLTACGGSSSNSPSAPKPVPQPTPVGNTTDYQAIIDELIDSGIPGAVLHIQSDKVSFLGSSGVSNTTQLTPMETSAQMPTGSSGKKATALLAMLLARDGLFDLDDPINLYLPDTLLSQIQYSSDMTIRHLLNHTSGIHNYLAEDTAGIWLESLLADPESLKTDTFALQLSLNKPGHFEPGNGFYYSNTGYLLVGLIMDSVLGEHHAKALRERIIEPLELNQTYYNGVEKGRGEIISGYFEINGDTVDTKPYYENIGVADAPLVSTVEDMSKLLTAIVTSDQLLNDEIRSAMYGQNSLIPTGGSADYGLGIFSETVNGKTLLHHGGQEPGYETTNIYIKESDTVITLFVNCGQYTYCETERDKSVQKILQSLL